MLQSRAVASPSHDSTFITEITPQAVLVSVGFSVVGYSSGFGLEKISEINFQKGYQELQKGWRPSAIRESYGSLAEWAKVEFIPSSGPGITNYFLHTFAEGMLLNRLERYYVKQGFSNAKARVWSLVTLMTGQIMNEWIEAPIVPSGDALADLIFFNPLGYALYSFTPLLRTMEQEGIQLNLWPGQAFIDVRDGALYNNQEIYALQLPIHNSTRLLFLLGIPTIGIGWSMPFRDRWQLHTALTIMPTPVTYYPYDAEGVPQKHPAHAIDSLPAMNRSASKPWGLWLSVGERQNLKASVAIGIRNPSITFNWCPESFTEDSWGLGGYVHWSTNTIALGISCSVIPIMPSFRVSY